MSAVRKHHRVPAVGREGRNTKDIILFLFMEIITRNLGKINKTIPNIIASYFHCINIGLIVLYDPKITNNFDFTYLHKQYAQNNVASRYIQVGFIESSGTQYDNGP